MCSCTFSSSQAISIHLALCFEALSGRQRCCPRVSNVRSVLRVFSSQHFCIYLVYLLRICDVVAVAVTTIACDGSHANLHASVCAYTQIVAKIVLGRRLHNDRRLRKAMASLEAPSPLAIEEPNSKPHLSFRNLLQRSQHCHLDDEAFEFESKTSKTAAL